jgi:hypothetical protein
MRMNVAGDEVLPDSTLACDQDLALGRGHARGSGKERSHLRVCDHEGIRIRDVCTRAQEIT